MSLYNAQQRFAKQLAKQKNVLAKQQAMKREVDVPLSTEMMDWLASSFDTREDSDGLGLPELKEDVGSVLVQPLDSMAVYCPVGAIMTNPWAAARSNNNNDDEEHRPPSLLQGAESSMLTTGGASFGFNRVDSTGKVDEVSLASHSQSATMGQNSSTLSSWAQFKKPPPPVAALPINSAISRLKVMWLQRKAQFEREDGSFNEAIETLDDALKLHLGTANDYNNANLADKVHNNPSELLDYIAETYVSYDKTAHIEAGRIQRCFLRHFRYRKQMAIRIQAAFRMYRVRRGYWDREELRKMCIQLIQRRYRRRLAMLRAMSTLIKRWYKSQVWQREYRRELYTYRMARRIQRLWRGNKNREISWQRRCEKYGNLLLQRQARSCNSRRKRTFAIKFFHRMFFRAARTIQTLVRAKQAVRRAQLKLLLELAREEDRQSREADVVDETIRVQINKTRLYMKTDAGRVHMEIELRRLRLQDREYHRHKAKMTKEEIMAHEAMVAFELFDSDGSGRIDSDELAAMLQQLCISATSDEVDALMKEISPDGEGEIDFGDFMEWYCGGGGEGSDASKQSLAQQTFKMVLQARHAVMELSGQIVQQRAERSILRQATGWLTKDITASFRNTHAPKFQCCQCMQPFVLFTDYFEHFEPMPEGGGGLCGVTNLKALFFPRFWIKRDWQCQRQVEHEIMRVNDELPAVNYHAYMAAVEDLSLYQDAGVSEILNKHTKAAQIMFMEKVSQGKESSGKIPTVNIKEEILGAVNVCNDNFVSALTATMIASRLSGKIPSDWVVEDRWDYGEFSAWLGRLVDEDVSKRKGFTFSERGKLKLDCWVVADVYVRTIRQLQITAEASLFAILDSRIRRPRKLSVLSDAELKKAGLDFLTVEKYEHAKEAIVEKLRILNVEAQRVLTVHVPKRCASKKAKGGEVRVGPDGLIPPDVLQTILIGEAHARAFARYKSRERSRVGGVQLRRLACELWADRRLLRESEEMKGKRQLADVRFIYNLFASEETGDGIDFWDFDELQSSLSIRVREAFVDEVKRMLGAEVSGLIVFERLAEFVLGGAIKKYASLVRAARNAVAKAGKAAMLRLYVHYAQQLLVNKMRKIARLELDFRTKSVRALLLSAALPPEKVVEFRERLWRAEEAAAMRAAEERRQEHMKEMEGRPWILFIPDKPTRFTLPPLPEPPKPEPPRPSEEEQRKTAALEKALGEMHDLEGEAKHVNEVLGAIRSSNEEQENLLLYRLAEDDAEAQCRRRLTTVQGLRDLATERLLMGATDNIIKAYGFLVPPNALYPWTHDAKQQRRGAAAAAAAEEEGEAEHSKGWDLTLAILVYLFDTDCSGTFDEGEVRLLLRCAKCGLSERQVLYHFPEVRLDSSTLNDVVNYLVRKIGWRRGLLGRLGSRGGVYLNKTNSWITASMLLISLSRQMAREKAEQATQLAKKGELLEEDDDKNDDALMMRSQMLAMRQVVLFLSTSQGKIQLGLSRDRVKFWFNEDCWKAGFTRRGLLQYAYLLHAERATDPHSNMLVTELPHLLGYLVSALGFRTKESVVSLAEKMAQVKTKQDVVWMSRLEVLETMEGVLEESAPQTATRGQRALLGARIAASRSTRSDAIVNMQSRARQQAVLIALEFEGIFVAESNYRCSILGLNDVLRANRQGRGPRRSELLMQWQRVPKEATPFLLLSRGYLVRDLFLGDVPKYAEVAHRQGGIAMEKVDVTECIRVARETTEVLHNNVEGAYRWARWLAGIPRYLEYRRIAKAVVLQRREITEAGAVYLREILTGQSSCVRDDEELGGGGE